MLPRVTPVFSILMFEFYISTKTPLSNQFLTEKNNSLKPNLINFSENLFLQIQKKVFCQV